MATRPRIAVVGASVRGAAFSLLREGYAVVTADLFADADLLRVCPAERVTNYPYELAEWLARTECEGWLYTGALENYPELVDQMATRCPLWGNPGTVLRRVRDPLILQETLTAADLCFPETRACNGQPQGAGAWLHKSGQGSSGSGVRQLDSASRPKEGYWQRRVPGLAGSALFKVSENCCQLLGITRQLVGESWTGARPFQYAGSLAPWELSAEVVAKITKLGTEISIEFNLQGSWGFDFIFNEEQVWPVEVNPRTTAAAEVIERATHAKTFAGKIVLYAKHPLEVSQATSDQLLNRAGSFVHPHLADIPNPSTPIASGEPILTVFAEGNSLAEVENKLRQQAIDLETKLYGNVSSSRVGIAHQKF